VAAAFLLLLRVDVMSNEGSPKGMKEALEALQLRKAADPTVYISPALVNDLFEQFHINCRIVQLRVFHLSSKFVRDGLLTLRISSSSIVLLGYGTFLYVTRGGENTAQKFRHVPPVGLFPIKCALFEQRNQSKNAGPPCDHAGCLSVILEHQRSHYSLNNKDWSDINLNQSCKPAVSRVRQ
jgi:hypothetical protein